MLSARHEQHWRGPETSRSCHPCLRLADVEAEAEVGIEAGAETEADA